MSENINILEKFNDICACFKDYPLAKHSTFRIGGKAEYCAFPETVKELCELLRVAEESGVQARVFGGASNILFSSSGVKGLIIFTVNMKGITPDGNQLFAFAGTRLSELCNCAAKENLSGAEFLYGIPGTVGGAVYMNAGAHGGEISHILVESICYDTEKRKLISLSHAEHEFSYRKSVFEKRPLIVIGSCFSLKKGEREEIETVMKSLTEKRKASQPLTLPSAGSVFKRPTVGFAGKYIEDAGLKGATVGGAQISEKHAGFIVNIGGATSQDVLELAEKAKTEVFRKFGVMLETEIIYVE